MAFEPMLPPTTLPAAGFKEALGNLPFPVTFSTDDGCKILQHTRLFEHAEDFFVNFTSGTLTNTRCNGTIQPIPLQARRSGFLETPGKRGANNQRKN